MTPSFFFFLYLLNSYSLRRKGIKRLVRVFSFPAGRYPQVTEILGSCPPYPEWCVQLVLPGSSIPCLGMKKKKKKKTVYWYHCPRFSQKSFWPYHLETTRVRSNHSAGICFAPANLVRWPAGVNQEAREGKLGYENEWWFSEASSQRCCRPGLIWAAQ